MARIDNLTNFLTDVATAIKTKKEDDTNILASEFDTEILALPSQGEYQIKTLEITGNGNYIVEPDENYDAMTQVNIIANVCDVNVYVQTTEPQNKKGVWLQTEGQMQHLLNDNSIYMKDTYIQNTDIPYSFSGSVQLIGTDIYLIGGYNGGSSELQKYMYKYDILTDTYIRLSDIPYGYNVNSTAVVGTDIYLFGGTLASTNYRYAYKYDTLTDTYTRLTSVPYNFGSGAVTSVGTNVYLFGSYTASANAYKYDTLTDTYTKLTNIPYNLDKGTATAIGTNIYLLGGGSNISTNAYKYDTLTDTYTELTNIPYEFNQGRTTVIETEIYLLGGFYSAYNNYKYDTLTDTYTELSNIPYNFNAGGCASVNGDIYLFGSVATATTYKTSEIYHAKGKSYEYNNSVITTQDNSYGSAHSTELLTIESSVEGFQPLYTFTNVWFYDNINGLDDTIPTYYGDGVQWINFKNPPQSEE